ncbi:MAG: outer membrane protein assembly factor BamB family protein [Acidimicrobiales bacterium]
MPRGVSKWQAVAVLSVVFGSLLPGVLGAAPASANGGIRQGTGPPIPAGAATTSLRYQDATAYNMTAGHTGASPDQVGPKWNELWSTAVSPSAPNVAASTVSYPLIVGGQVFVIANGGSAPGLYGLDASTGAVNWGPDPLAGVYGPVGLAYDNGKVFTANSSGLLAEWSATNGSNHSGPPR